jgi:hypothetical protein
MSTVSFSVAPKKYNRFTSSTVNFRYVVPVVVDALGISMPVVDVQAAPIWTRIALVLALPPTKMQ